MLYRLMPTFRLSQIKKLNAIPRRSWDAEIRYVPTAKNEHTLIVESSDKDQDTSKIKDELTNDQRREELNDRDD